jgi:hypothetical protein
MAGFQSCLTEIQKAVGREMSDDELELVGDEIADILRRSEGDAIAQKQMMAEAAERYRIAAIIQKRNAMLNRARRLEIVDFALTSYPDRPELAFEAKLSGVTKGARVGSRSSVFATQVSLAAKHGMALMAELRDKNLAKAFNSGALDREIWRAIHQLDAETPNMANIPQEAVDIAKAIQRQTESLRVLANQNGASIGKLAGYVIKQTHNYAKIRGDVDGWTRYMDEFLDWERSFPEVSDPVKRQELLKDLYMSLASGVHLSHPAGRAERGGRNIDASFEGVANIGRKISQDRVLHFKDADAEYNYNVKYGAGNLGQGVMYGIESMARNIGIMHHLGPNADNNLKLAMKEVLREIKKRGDPDALSKAENKMNRIMERLWPNVNGLVNVPGNKMLAQVSAIGRAIQQLSKLGGALLSSFVDLPTYASEIRYQGGGMLSGLAESVGSIGAGMGAAEKARLLSAIGVFHDGMLSAAPKRYDPNNGVPGAFSSAVNTFYTLNLLRGWTDNLRTGFALARSRYLGDIASMAYADIHPDMQRVLNIYNLGEAEWSLLSRATEQADDGNIYMTAEGVESLGDDIIGGYVEAKGGKATPASIRRARQEVAQDFRNYFLDRSTTAVPEPDAKTRSYLLGGTQAGTPEHEILSHIMLFKSFPTAILQRVLSREIYGKGATTMKEALKNGNGEMLGLANLIVWNTAFGYLSMTAKDLAKGKTPRDPEDPKTYMAAMVQGGGLGIYGDFLFGEMKNRYGGGALSTLLGPTAGTFDSVVDIAQRARDGDDVAAQTFRTVLNNTPFINLFYTRAALDYLILYQIGENLNPGYLSRMEKRSEKETGSTFIYPPSQYAVGN